MVKVGDTIKIIYMDGEPHYSSKVGIVEHIDDIGQIHGSWGGCALIPGVDEFEIVNEVASKKKRYIRNIIVKD